MEKEIDNKKFLRQRLLSQCLHYDSVPVLDGGSLGSVCSRLVSKHLIPREKTGIADVVLRLMVGNPLRMTEEAFESILGDLKSCRASTHYEMRQKVCRVSAADWIAKSAALEEMVVSGVCCRVTRVCDFCDFAVSIAYLLSIRFRDAFGLLGGDVGHSLCANGKTPLSQSPMLGCVERFPLDTYGLDNYSPTWRPPNVTNPAALERGLKVEAVSSLNTALVEIPVASPPPPPELENIEVDRTDVASCNQDVSEVVVCRVDEAEDSTTSCGREVSKILEGKKKLTKKRVKKKQVPLVASFKLSDDVGVVVKRHKSF